MEIITLAGIILGLLLPYFLTKLMEKQIRTKFNLYPNDVFVASIANVGGAAFLIAAYSDEIAALQLPIILGTLILVIALVLGKHKVPAAYGIPFAICRTAAAVIYVFWAFAKICLKFVFDIDQNSNKAHTTKAKNRSVELQRQGKSEDEAAAQANHEEMTALLNHKKYDNPLENGPIEP